MDVKRLLVLVSSLCLSVVSPAQARDRVIARDTEIQAVYALGGDLVYHRDGRPAYMRYVNGKLAGARGIPENGGASAIGRDAKGRTILTFAAGGRWFAYDLAGDRSRPLHGLPGDCMVEHVSLWRRSMAYSLRCDDEARTGVYVKQGTRTGRIAAASIFEPFAFRGGALAGLVDDGLDNAYIDQYMADGKICHERVDSSFGDASAGNPWYPSDLWLGNGSITFMMGHWSSRPNFALLSAKLAPACAAPRPVGQYRFRPPVKSIEALTIDGRRVFYADGKALRLHPLPAKPSYRRPRNDDFEHAKPLAGGAPVSVTGNVAHATVQRGEPLEDARHTVWYAFRPQRSVSVEMSVAGAHTYGVYTGDRVDKLRRVAAPSRGITRFDAVAGRTYWIAVAGALPEPKYQPFTVRIDPLRADQPG